MVASYLDDAEAHPVVPSIRLTWYEIKTFHCSKCLFVKKNIYIKECLNVEKLLSFNLKIVSNVQIMFTFLFQLSPAHQRGHHQCGKDDEETDQKIFRSLNSFFFVFYSISFIILFHLQNKIPV